MMETIMYFWWNYSDSNYISRILFDVKKIDNLFCMAGALLESDKLHLFLLSDGTRIDDNKYLES